MNDSRSEPSADEVAEAILESVPPVMREIRSRMRAGRPAGLSIPQFRVLLYVSRNPGTSLSRIAEHLGTTVPATSELVARLVRQGLMRREQAAAELRRIQLTLSESGAADLDDARRSTVDWLRGLAAPLDPDRRGTMLAALRELRGFVESEPGHEAMARDLAAGRAPDSPLSG
jgi:DNA-binding MarR family transcriptional regulator